MAIDTANKRRNAYNICTPFLMLSLLPSVGIDADDRENASGAYIGFEYEEAPPVVSTKSRLRVGVGIGLGL